VLRPARRFSAAARSRARRRSASVLVVGRRERGERVERANREPPSRRRRRLGRANGRHRRRRRRRPTRRRGRPLARPRRRPLLSPRREASLLRPDPRRSERDGRVLAAESFAATQSVSPITKKNARGGVFSFVPHAPLLPEKKTTSVTRAKNK
jgi:hypothetical protein